MKVLSIILCKIEPKQNPTPTPILLSTVVELNEFGYFQRGSVKEVILFVSREVLQRGTPGERQSVKHKEYLCHSYINAANNVGAAVVTDEEYPTRVAYSLINRILDEFNGLYGSKVESITTDVDLKMDLSEKLIKEYQDPAKADSVSKIQKDLDETKDVMYKTIDQLLQRGEKLDVLAEKSQDLSFQSKAFMKSSESLNSCCIII